MAKTGKGDAWISVHLCWKKSPVPIVGLLPMDGEGLFPGFGLVNRYRGPTPVVFGISMWGDPSHQLIFPSLVCLGNVYSGDGGGRTKIPSWVRFPQWWTTVAQTRSNPRMGNELRNDNMLNNRLACSRIRKFQGGKWLSLRQFAWAGINWKETTPFWNTTRRHDGIWEMKG